MSQSPKELPPKLLSHEILTRAFTERVGKLTVSRSDLAQTASWRASNDSPITLEYLIACKFPAEAKILGIPKLEVTDEEVKLIGELNEDELKKVAIERAKAPKAGFALTRGGVTYRGPDLVNEVLRETPVGRSFVDTIKSGAQTFEDLISQGKVVRITEDEPEKPTLPAFDF